MDAIMPWEELYELVKLCYYKGVRGNKPYDLELMLRVAKTDSQTEYDVRSGESDTGRRHICLGA